jgi:hypothetical protein
MVSQPRVRPTPPVVDRSLSADEAQEIAIEAYLYAYPIVIMDVTARVAATGGYPANQFRHIPVFPDATFTEVVRPNADTLYSSLTYDVSREPLVIVVPEPRGRYFLLPVLDMWTDVFASPGTRTTGDRSQTFVIIGPGWSGTLPSGVGVYQSPTACGWLIGRTQTNGVRDYDAVHAFQAGLTAVPLSSYGRPYALPSIRMQPDGSSEPPVEQVAAMDVTTFFRKFVELTAANPPHVNDYPQLSRMRRIGIAPAEAFDLQAATPQIRDALIAAAPAAQAKLSQARASLGTAVNGWRMIGNPIGTYGTDYLRRAIVANSGLGANTREDAIYPSAFTDIDGRPLDSSDRYVMHFEPDQLPPVRAFWSLTMYNDAQFFAANVINRYAIGDRDNLLFNDDGSLDLYVQRASPGGDTMRNWLPAPSEGSFSMNLRLYWPKPDALEGAWAPPAVRRDIS